MHLKFFNDAYIRAIKWEGFTMKQEGYNPYAAAQRQFRSRSRYYRAGPFSPAAVKTAEPGSSFYDSGKMDDGSTKYSTATGFNTMLHVTGQREYPLPSSGKRQIPLEHYPCGWS